jgi:hypothetical protein
MHHFDGNFLEAKHFKKQFKTTCVYKVRLRAAPHRRMPDAKVREIAGGNVTRETAAESIDCTAAANNAGHASGAGYYRKKHRCRRSCRPCRGGDRSSIFKSPYILYNIWGVSTKIDLIVCIYKNFL